MCCLHMTKAEPGVMQLGQSVTVHGIGSPALCKVLGITDFRKYSWRRQEVDDVVERAHSTQYNLLYIKRNANLDSFFVNVFEMYMHLVYHFLFFPTL